MELRVLKYFLALAREENISKAAEIIHISQPSLSKQLKELEEEIGKQDKWLLCMLHLVFTGPFFKLKY